MTSESAMNDVSPADSKAIGGTFRVLIAGGGVAALEALLAMREMAGDRIEPVLLAPDPVFRHRPLSVTEPFDLGTPRNLDLLEIALEQGATFMRDGLAEVIPDARTVRTAEGRRLEYDALLLAIGTRATEAVPGALTFRDSADEGSFRELLAELEQATDRHLVFAVPGGTSWALGLYELALLSSAHLRERGLGDVELTLVTPEARPMELFGRRASDVVGGALADAGIAVHLNCKPVRFEGSQLILADGDPISCDRVISLPKPEVMPIPGVPQQTGTGFIPIDRFGGVMGVERVFAAGDVTWFPIKQGGLAAQMADCAASAIAALAGAPVDPQPFRPVLRGALLTPAGPRYLRAPVGGSGDVPRAGTAARSPLWWPPAKVAGKHLAPYLATRAGYPDQTRALDDLDAPVGDDGSRADSGHEDILAVALAFADESARARDFRRALGWLEVAEDLELYLPSEYELKRISWQGLAAN